MRQAPVRRNIMRTGRPSGRSPLATATNRRRLSIVIVLIVLGIAGYVFRADVVDFFSPPPPPDVSAINRAVDSAFVVIDPQEVASATADIEDCEIPTDRVVLPKGASVLRANLTLTRAVERAGGTVLYGVESTDRKRRWQTVTLGISAGDSLIREVMLVSRVR
jgi:hypothetical protein